ncbi:MAG: pyrroline-5-carboxylate reductase [Deltaproteobacteria bacterium]|uniref:Pyrroline-5-carboxylate reductase n=1 Tax=Candidatus Zymogenus saltonus TaxID=2844893 RepID=A0A9D8KJ65_9DELT|nr:pyrroline-5-carboxylate reductase [Candidatus Zymogenus saltonus]
MDKMTVGFLGSGNMAEALIRGILGTGRAGADRIIATDISRDRLKYISETYSVKTAENPVDMARGSDVIFIATKPAQIGEALRSVNDVIDQKKLVISIAAGITIAFIEQRLKKNVPVIRVMPNTPALVLAGMAALSAGSSATDEHMQIALSIFSAVGEAVVVDEGLIDAVTALSGSGPAYVFMVIEAMADGGVKAGLSRHIALKLAAQTVMGAAKMVIETGRHPGELKDMVTSPGGTTIEALSVLEDNGVRGAFIEAVEAAFLKAKELGKKG